MKKNIKILALLLCAVMLTAACVKKPELAPNPVPEAPEISEEPVSAFDPSPLQINAIDGRTLEVRLKTPTPYFLELTSFPTYMPVKKDIVEQHGDAWATAPETYIGNGAYKITEWVPGSHITMEKNENYWDAANVGPKRIKFHLIEDPTPQLNAYQAGELDFIDDVPTAEVETLKQNPDFHVPSQLGTYYVSFNHEAAPFDDPLVRKAFSLAIDRKYMADVIGSGVWLPADAWVPAGMKDGSSDFREAGGEYIDFNNHAANLEAAKAALAEAGYPGGEGLPAIEYIYNDSSIHPQIAEAMQNMWGELGATVNLSAQEWATFVETRSNGDYVAARNGWVNDYMDPVGMLDLFVTGGGNNAGRYANPEYDALIKQIKTEEDDAERMRLLHRAEDTLMNDWVFAPILYFADPYMVPADIAEGVVASPLAHKLFMDVTGKEELNVCLGGNTATIDPALNTTTDGSSYIRHAFEGLYRLDSNDVPVPGLAESVDISEDGLTYTFRLREGLKWSDGSPLTAEDIRYSWIRAINPETASDYSYIFDIIAGYDEAAGMAE